MRRRRTQFVAPFVVTVASVAGTAACTKKENGTSGAGTAAATTTPAAQRIDAMMPVGNPPPPEHMAAKKNLGQMHWDVLVRPDAAAKDQGCMAMADIECPPPDQGTCNPPPPTYTECPPAHVTHTLVQRTDGTCMWLPEGCDSLDCAGDKAVVTACPTWGSLPAHQWSFAPTADKKACTFTPTPRCAGDGCTVAAFDAACPKTRSQSGIIVVRPGVGDCAIEHAMKCPEGATCNPPPPEPVPCPVAPAPK